MASVINRDLIFALLIFPFCQAHEFSITAEVDTLRR